MKKKLIDYKWICTIILLAFTISVIFTLISELAIPNVNILVGVFLTLLFIFIGVIFDMIGVAASVSPEAPFHSMATKRVKGATTAIKLKKNADKVSSFCNDVIGDICGIISGATGSVVALKISDYFGCNRLIIVVITMGIISALTIGGKALEKSIAINKSDKILYKFATILNIFWR